jgi:hypothetical protein
VGVESAINVLIGLRILAIANALLTYSKLSHEKGGRTT